MTNVLVALLFRLFGCFAYINLCFLVMLLAFLLSVEVIDSEYHLWNELYVGRGINLAQSMIDSFTSVIKIYICDVIVIVRNVA